MLSKKSTVTQGKKCITMIRNFLCNAKKYLSDMLKLIGSFLPFIFLS